MLAISGVMLLVAAARGDAGLRVPATIASVAAATFLIGAMMLPAAAAGRQRLVTGLAVLLLAAFTAIGGWIALGPGPRQCTGGWSADDQRPVSGTGCRVAFGIGALITAGIAVVALRQLLRSRGRSSS